jgi:class 3 adenylate cyclase/predicted ATPase
MQEVEDWLKKLGLGQYAKSFADHGVDDLSILPRLTDQDLEKLGLLLGHRRKLLHAIASPPTEAAPPKTETLAGGELPRPDTAERRQLTVMFCDLVASSTLAAKLDPEDMREVILAYQTACSGVMPTYDGFVAKFMGDGVLAYFGYPRAHEDDPERAVRAGLDIVAAVGRIGTRSGVKLQVRIGIATGLVVVGDLIGEGASQERAVVGDTPNLAARLQGIAEPNTVVIAESTHRLLGNLFELQDLGARDLKGIAGPARGWEVLRASSVESRFEALHATGLTALVGRDEELELLLRRWARAKAGEGQVVLLSGEAGIGKSRLTAALIEHVAGEPRTRLRYFCSPQRTDSALYPIIGQLERAARMAHDDTPQAKLDKLDAVLAQTSTPIEDAALFAEMLSLPNDGRYPTRELDPQQRRQRTLQALLSQLESLARQEPVLMIFEDAHWTDPTSLEAFGRVVDRIQTLPVLLIVTFRPDFQSAWVGQAHVTSLTINRLTQREVGAMIDRVVCNKLLPASIRRDITDRTDGIPLFVEEMTKAVLEAESEAAVQHTIAAVPSPALAVPPSLHASLMARLDRLGTAKELAQIAAAIGREFSHALLAAVAREPEAELSSALDRLVGAGLLFRQGVPPHASYLFKHALVRDAAYGTLLREPRRALHARIGEVLEVQFAETAETRPELLAHHCTEAGLLEKAVGLWGKAGLRSLARSALIEALEQLTRALGLIASLPSTPSLRREEIKLQVALLDPLKHIKGQGAPETRAAAERARFLIEQAEALGEPIEDPLLLFSALHTFYWTYLTAFDGPTAREGAERLLALAENQAAKLPRIRARGFLGAVFVWTGNFTEGRVYLDQALALCDPAERRQLALRFGVDSRSSASGSMALWALGYPSAATATIERGLKDVREIGLAITLMQTISLTFLTQLVSGDYTGAKAQSDELLLLAEEKGSHYWKTVGLIRRASLLAATGKSTDAIAIFASTISAWRSTGTKMFLPVWLSHMAKAHGDLGQFDEARSCVDEALTAIETTKETWYEAEAHRIAGEVDRMWPERDTARAEAYFERALAVARQQRAKSWELRAAMSMARLWRDQGKRQQARDLLAPIYGWFTEGFDTLDLKEAKALLEQLSAI